MRGLIVKFKTTLLCLALAFFSTQALASDNIDTVTFVVADLGLTSANTSQATTEEMLDFYERFADYVYNNMRGGKRNKVYILSSAFGRVVWQGTARSFEDTAGNLYEKLTKLDYIRSDGADMRGHAMTDIKAVFETIKNLEQRHTPLETSQIFMFSSFIDSVSSMEHAPKNENGQRVFDISLVIEENIKSLASYIDIGADKEAVEERILELYWLDDAVYSAVDEALKNHHIEYTIATKEETRTLFD